LSRNAGDRGLRAELSAGARLGGRPRHHRATGRPRPLWREGAKSGLTDGVSQRY